MSHIDPDELEMDEIAAQIDDLSKKFMLDIAEGHYSAYIALHALRCVTVDELLYGDETKDTLADYVDDLEADFESRPPDSRCG